MIMMDLISVLFGMTAPIRQNLPGYSHALRGRKRIPSLAPCDPGELAHPPDLLREIGARVKGGRGDEMEKGRGFPPGPDARCGAT